MKVVLMLMLTILLFVMGCSDPESTAQEKEEVDETDQLILAIGSEPDTGFDPTTGWGRYGSPLFQSTLLKRDSELNIEYDLATEYELSDDGLVWTLRLREDAVFTDGEKVTGHDVQFTFETAKNSGSVLDLNVLDRVETEDDLTVKFYLTEPRSTFVHSLETLGIIPEHAYDDNYGENPVGSGPFKLVQWDKGQQIIIEANDDYYDSKPYFQRITFLFLNEDAALAAAKAGQVDMSYIPVSFSTQDVENMVLEELPSVDNRGVMFPYVESGQVTEDGYPIGNDVTADIAIRQAINVALDRQALVDGVIGGNGSPAYSAFDGLPWWNSETVIDDGNLELAEEILKNAGWEDKNEDGILEKADLEAEFKLLYPASDVTRQSLAIVVADMIKPLGINIIVEGKSWDEIETMMYSNAVLFGWGNLDPIDMYNIYSSQYAGVDYFNTGYYSNPTVDEYLDKALSAIDEETAMEYWKKAQWDGETGFSTKGDAPWAWLVNIHHLYLVNENLNIGHQKIQPHGHGWPITDNLVEWRWND